MSITQIKRRLEAILSYMEAYWEFVDCHMVNYLTNEHWKVHICKNLQHEVPNVQLVQNCIDKVFWKKHSETEELQFPAITKFLHTALQHTCAKFPEIITDLQQLRVILNNNKIKQQPTISIKEFMSEKKQHEVEQTAALVNELIENYVDANSADIYVVDAGDGKGYLSSRLALQYNYKVLGIDANAQNSENALKRNTKLQRAWNGLTERAILLEAGIKPPRRGKKIKKNTEIQLDNCNTVNYCTASQFITPVVNLVELLQVHFPEINNNQLTPAICLTGLHTCGNLAATCLKVFDTQPDCRILCNIGCCYHLLTEAYRQHDEFSNLSLIDKQTDIGFPLSAYLNQRQVQLGRNARMLAAQSLERTLAMQELPNKSLFYRALLEVLLQAQNENYRNKQVGKLRKFENFQQYVELSMKKLNIEDVQFTAQDIEEMEKKYADEAQYLNLFYLLRQCLAPVVESLILLDRLLYLKELGYENSYLVPLFDAITSPRHFAIIALK